MFMLDKLLSNANKYLAELFIALYAKKARERSTTQPIRDIVSVSIWSNAREKLRSHKYQCKCKYQHHHNVQ